MDKNGKSRHSVWLSDEVWQEVDAFYKLDNCPTRNEFVEKALRQYCGRLHTERTSAYLPRALQEMLEGTLGVFGNRLGKLLFKLVVEHNMTNHLLGGDICPCAVPSGKLAQRAAPPGSTGAGAGQHQP